MSFLEIKRECDVKVTYKQDNCAFPAHFHRNIEFLYPTGGQMEVLLAGEKVLVPQNSLLIIDSLCIHHILTDETGISLCLPLSYLTDFFTYYEGKEFAKVCIDDEDGCIKEMLLAFKNPRANELLEKARVNEFLGFLVEKVGVVDKKEKTDSGIVEQTIIYINEHFESELTLDLIASKLSYNKYTLSHRFKKATGMDLRTYIINVRLNEFIGKLVCMPSSQKSFIEYAYAVGFGSVQSFYRAFKKRYGMTPKEYRKQLVATLEETE